MCTRSQSWHTGAWHVADSQAMRTFCGLSMYRAVRTICLDHEPALYGVTCGACKRTNAYKACVVEDALGDDRGDVGLQGIMTRHADRVLGQ